MKKLHRIIYFFTFCIFTAAAAISQTPATFIHPKGDSLQLNGKTIWYESEGKGEPLILIAGGPGLSHSYFHPFFSALADSFRVIYFDSFGCGKSGKDDLTKNYSIAIDVEIIEALRKELGLGKVNILGHSYGGFVAQEYALKYQRSLNRLILCNTLSGGNDLQSYINSFNQEIKSQFPELWEKIMKIRAKGYLSSSKEHQSIFSFPGTLHNFYNPENRSKFLANEPDSYNPDLWYKIAGKDADFVISNELVRYNAAAKLKNLTIPVLIVAGRFDRNIKPEITVKYKQLIPKGKFIMFEESGHFPFLEENDKFIKIIRSFLADR